MKILCKIIWSLSKRFAFQNLTVLTGRIDLDCSSVREERRGKHLWFAYVEDAEWSGMVFAAECWWSGTVFLGWSVGDLECVFWCRVCVIWNGFLQRSVGDLERFIWCGVRVIWNGLSDVVCGWSGMIFLKRSVGDLERFIWCGVWVIWNGFLKRSVGDLKRFFWCGVWVIWNGFLGRIMI